MGLGFINLHSPQILEYLKRIVLKEPLLCGEAMLIVDQLSNQQWCVLLDHLDSLSETDTRMTINTLIKRSGHQKTTWINLWINSPGKDITTETAERIIKLFQKHFRILFEDGEDTDGNNIFTACKANITEIHFDDSQVTSRIFNTISYMQSLTAMSFFNTPSIHSSRWKHDDLIVLRNFLSRRMGECYFGYSGADGIQYIFSSSELSF